MSWRTKISSNLVELRFVGCQLSAESNGFRCVPSITSRVNFSKFEKQFVLNQTFFLFLF
jgi:hypothetical protein